jgi:hypothetical protein
LWRRVGDAEHLQQALHAAVLAVAAVQRQEGDVDARLTQHQIDVAVDEDRDGVVAAIGQRRQDGLTGADRHVPLRREPAEEYADLAMSAHHSPVTSRPVAVKKMHRRKRPSGRGGDRAPAKRCSEAVHGSTPLPVLW